MVLALPHSALDYSGVEVATELAECLGVQCLGTFIVEPAIASLGVRPGAQEFKSIAAGWQPIELENLARDIQDAAAAARRRFAAAAGGRSTEAVFHLIHGVTGEIVTSLARHDDIVAMIEPRHPADRITRQFRDFMEAAFQASSSVMLLPSRVVRQQGPVVAVATKPDDAAIELATQVAGAMHEPLVIVNATGGPIAADAMRGATRTQPRIISTPIRGLSIEDQVLSGLADVRERLIVARRAIFDGARLRTMAEKRRVPVLTTGGSE
jgi:hypothetical protein